MHGYIPMFFLHVYKGKQHQFCDSLFASLAKEAVPKWARLLKKRFRSCRSEIFFFKGRAKLKREAKLKTA